MRKALIASGNSENRSILFEMLKDDFSIAEAKSADEALEIIQSEAGSDISVILMDLTEPEPLIYVVIKAMQELNLSSRFPIVAVTDDFSKENEVRCLKLGVTDFIRKPYDKNLVRLRTGNVASLFELKNGLEKKINIQTAKLAEQNERLEHFNQSIIELLGEIVEARNRETGQHVNRIKTYTRIIAEDVKEHYPEYGLTNKEVDLIATASALHDVGKIAISDAILLKPEKLTNEEYEEMKQHCLRGCEIISRASNLWSDIYGDYAKDICHYHHERYDGKGYPEGLKGEEIPISAQIVALADVYDALVSERVYKKALSSDDAYTKIVNGHCGAFNPKILDSFTRCKPLMEKSL